MKKINHSIIVIILVIVAGAAGWVMTSGGKYDHVSWSLMGFEAQQFTVGDTGEQIEIRLDTSGRSWDLDFDDEYGILVKQDGETILEGWFFPSDEFTLWEEDFLNGAGYTIIKAGSTEESSSYFCLSDGGGYVFLTKIDNSEYSAIFFTSKVDISQEKAWDASQRIAIIANT